MGDLQEDKGYQDFDDDELARVSFSVSVTTKFNTFFPL
jgi:hypothetical protein